MESRLKRSSTDCDNQNSPTHCAREEQIGGGVKMKLPIPAVLLASAPPARSARLQLSSVASPNTTSDVRNILSRAINRWPFVLQAELSQRRQMLGSCPSRWSLAIAGSAI